MITYPNNIIEGYTTTSQELIIQLNMKGTATHFKLIECGATYNSTAASDDYIFSAINWKKLSSNITDGNKLHYTIARSDVSGYVKLMLKLKDSKENQSNVKSFLFKYKSPPVLYTVTVAATQNGSVTPTTQSGYIGDIVEFTVTPSENYSIDTVFVNSTQLTVTNNTVSVTIDGTTQVVYATFVENSTPSTFTINSVRITNSSLETITTVASATNFNIVANITYTTSDRVPTHIGFFTSQQTAEALSYSSSITITNSVVDGDYTTSDVYISSNITTAGSYTLYIAGKSNAVYSAVMSTALTVTSVQEVVRVSFGHYIGSGNTVANVTYSSGVNTINTLANASNYGASTEITTALPLTSNLGNVLGYLYKTQTPTAISAVYNNTDNGVSPTDVAAYLATHYQTNLWWQGGWAPRTGVVTFNNFTAGTYNVKLYMSTLKATTCTSNTTNIVTTNGTYKVDAQICPYNSNTSWMQISNVIVPASGTVTLNLATTTSDHYRVPLNIVEFVKV